MMNKTMLGSLFLLFAIAAATLAALNGGARTPPPAYACTGAWPSLDMAVRRSDAVAIVQTTAVGGTENSLAPLPTVTVPAGFATATAGQSQDFSLQGIGATVKVTQVLTGTLPSEFEVDGERRDQIERTIRSREANPMTITPCALDFMLLRYDVNQRYLVFLDHDPATGWQTSFRLRVSSSGDLIAGNDQQNPPLAVSRQVRDRFFPGIAMEGPNDALEESELWFATSTLPMSAVVAAIEAIEAGEIAPATPAPEHEGTMPTLTPTPGVTIAPPSVGDGGLR